MREWLIRMRYRLRFWRGYEKSLDRRAAVEDYLFRASRGKAPLPDAKKCHELATKLGVPR